MENEKILNAQTLDLTDWDREMDRIPDGEALEQSSQQSLIRIAAVLDEFQDRRAELSQEELDLLTARLKTALDHLQKLADYSSLDELVASIDRDFISYTPESLAVLRKALEAIDYSLPASRQKEVDAMEHNLYLAMQQLKKRELH